MTTRLQVWRRQRAVPSSFWQSPHTPPFGLILLIELKTQIQQASKAIFQRQSKLCLFEDQKWHKELNGSHLFQPAAQSKSLATGYDNQDNNPDNNANDTKDHARSGLALAFLFPVALLDLVLGHVAIYDGKGARDY